MDVKHGTKIYWNMEQIFNMHVEYGIKQARNKVGHVLTGDAYTYAKSTNLSYTLFPLSP